MEASGNAGESVSFDVITRELCLNRYERAVHTYGDISASVE